MEVMLKGSVGRVLVFPTLSVNGCLKAPCLALTSPLTSNDRSVRSIAETRVVGSYKETNFES